MKKYKIIIAVVIGFLVNHPCMVFSQITINNADMPAASDTFRLSITNNLHSVDPTVAGQNITWNFSALTPNSQTVDSFFNIASTEIPNEYYLWYGNPLQQAHLSNVVTRSFNTTNPYPQVQITEMYDFYKNSSASYIEVGKGAKVNSIPTALVFDNPEIFFTFPVTFGHVDSSTSKYSMSLPSIGYYGQTIKRVNTVDGYGTLITPYGTFNTMRVKSVINTRDTFYLDTIAHGFAQNLPKETQYIWLGDNQGDPLLQISKTGNSGNNYTIRYKDNLLVPNNIVKQDCCDDIFIYPNPVSKRFSITSKNKIGRVEIFNLPGKKSAVFESGFADMDLSGLPAGAYSIRIYNEQGILLKTNKLIKE
jgi:hypothetical protein